ncbi:hypothetical protein P152DRAFT_461397 [Eremomyces bilateralis CBS 781.70]|uniref:Mid2 domain-containing protein n=1 Tax=Eremomyces bilateralis CBS 781.70 TaxID=1392243 RepID=A0A6G1FUX0_9PEZI|nr:uncharacterized protein P152DRAFT_461397 [Eremomyces bilateralis CBS 781.70]KAF1809451.1 hypothetical protein P152DRAFT_461397 [Eremomyces bilateralis CBS 781.70]
MYVVDRLSISSRLTVKGRFVNSNWRLECWLSNSHVQSGVGAAQPLYTVPPLILQAPEQAIGKRACEFARPGLNPRLACINVLKSTIKCLPKHLTSFDWRQHRRPSTSNFPTTVPSKVDKAGIYIERSMADIFRDSLFTSKATDYVCPKWTSPWRFWCNAPSICTTDSRTSKQYCCNPGDICWAPTSACSGDGSTFTCTSGDSTWCCLKDKEICTQLTGQRNICYTTSPNPLQNFTESVLDDTFSSLSSAAPTASAYRFDLAALLGQTTHTSGQIADPTGTSSTSDGVPLSNSPSSGQPSAGSLSGGAIAGIVIGALAVVVIAALVVVLFLRYRQKPKNQVAQLAQPQTGPKYFPSVEVSQAAPPVVPYELQFISVSPAELPGYGNGGGR